MDIHRSLLELAQRKAVERRDHVEVLHEILGNTPKDELHADQRRALDHAIATCERHAALVARLGELEHLLRQREPDNGENYTEFDKGCEQASDEAADMIARVVKESE